MPNWCYNRITVYGNEQTEKIKEVEKIFESKTPFNDIFPQPDWKNTPNEKGELPIYEEMKHPDGSVAWATYNFPDGTNDDRWYHWCNENWGTKWEITLDKSEISFDEYNLQFYCDSAWCPPEVLLQDIADKYNVNVECFYEIEGYGDEGVGKDTYEPTSALEVEV